MCFALAADDSEFTIDCQELKSSRHSILKKYLERIEARDDTDNTNFSNITDYIDSL